MDLSLAGKDRISPGDKSGLDACTVLSQPLALEISVLQLHLPEVGSYMEKWGLCTWALGPWLLGASSLRRHQGPTILHTGTMAR